MRAMQIHELGGELTYTTDAPRPKPKAGEVLIRVAACGVNFADTLMVKGKYQEKPELPFAPGMEISGEIAEVGESVNLKPGQRVAAMCGNGGFAEYAIAPAAGVVETPADMPHADAAAFLIAYGTSHVALDYRVNMQPGENLLVLGAAGGVGVVDQDHERLGVGHLGVVQGLGAGDVAVVDRGTGRARLADAIGVELEDDVRHLGIRERPDQQPAGDAVADDHDVVGECAMLGRGLVDAGRAQQPLERAEHRLAGPEAWGELHGKT